MRMKSFLSLRRLKRELEKIKADLEAKEKARLEAESKASEMEFSNKMSITCQRT